MKLYRAFATVGGLTLVSRIMGFLRDIAFAALLGAGPIAEAFVVAFRFPNLFRRWFGEGAFNAAFVPLFTKRLEGEGREAARAFAGEALAGLAFVLLVLSALCMIAMPWIMLGLAPGFADTPAKFDLAVDMSRIAFPYLFCMSLVALLSGVLNAVGKFVESSAVSIVLNLTLMAAMATAWWLGYGNDPRTGYVLAWGIFAAGVLQLWLLVDGARRNGLMPRLTRPTLSPGVRRLVALGVPGIIAGGVTQLNIVIGSMIASLQDGAVSHLFYADRLYELPLAIVGIAIGVVLLPDVSRHLRAGDEAAVMDSQNRALELALLLTVPAAVALAVIPAEIVSVLYQRGAFRAADTIGRVRGAGDLRGRAAVVRDDQGVLARLLRARGYARRRCALPRSVSRSIRSARSGCSSCSASSAGCRISASPWRPRSAAGSMRGCCGGPCGPAATSPAMRGCAGRSP